VAERIAEDAAPPGLGACLKEVVGGAIGHSVGAVEVKGAEVVVEDERLVVVRILGVAGAAVAGAEVALRIVRRTRVLGGVLRLAPPGAVSAVRGDAGEGIVPSVRLL